MTNAPQEQHHEQPDHTGSGQSGDAPQNRLFYIEDPAGDLYRANAMSNTLVRDMAADFFEERGWSSHDRSGRQQRAVAELIDPNDPTQSHRLRGDQTLDEAGIRDNSTVRVLPESVAGAVNPRDRLRALTVDHREVKALVAQDPQNITLWTNASHTPTLYRITFHYTSFCPGERNYTCPDLSTEHRVEIYLPANYPLEAPQVHWKTSIFHPNIHLDGRVCLGVLGKRYMPGLGLAYIVRMLADMVRYHNYDLDNAFNPKAKEWAESDEGQAHILAMGGAPKEAPLVTLLEHVRRAERATRTTFERVGSRDD